MHYLNDIAEFVLFTVVLKMIVAHWLADKLVHVGSIWFGRAGGRAQAIWSHYQLRALGEGHRIRDITHCRDGGCATL